MKIKNIYIHSFGTLKNFSIDFTDGFNAIYGENENGKSTIMAFIKMMFYGSRIASGLKNIRNRYTPWDSSAMAGSVTFEHSGRNYRLEREFKTSNSTDKVTLFDLDIGTKQNVASDIGASLFGLSASAFEHSIFIGTLGNETMDKATEGEINAKLSNLSSSGDESISFTEIYSKLENAKLALNSKSGKAGILDKNRIKLSELEDSLKSLYDEQMNIKALIQKKEELFEEIENCEGKLNSARRTISNAEDIKNREKIKEMLSLKEKLDELNASLSLDDGKFIDELFVRSIMFSTAKIDSIEQKLSAKEKEEKLISENIEQLENPSADITPENAALLEKEIKTREIQLKKLNDDITALKANDEELKQEFNNAKSLKRPFNPLFLLIGAVLLAAAITLFVSSIKTPALLLSIVAVIQLLLGVLIKPINKTQLKKLNAKIEENNGAIEKVRREFDLLSSENAVSKQKLDSINSVLNSNSAFIEKQKAALEECKQQILDLLSSKSDETQKLFKFYSRYKHSDSVDEIKAELDMLSERASKQKELKQQLNYILKDLGNISYMEAKQKLETSRNDLPEQSDFSKITAEAEQLETLLLELKSNYASLSTEIALLEKTTPNPDLLSKEISELKQIIEKQEEFCESLNLAMEILNDSFAKFRRSYGSELEKKAADIFKGLTDNAYTAMNISKSFDINVEKNGIFGSKEVDYLSNGTADQVYLSLRLALADLISTDERLPVFLDDSLTQYDDKRTKFATDYLNRFAEDTQVIMFTCHGFVSQTSKTSGANIINLTNV